MIAIEEDRIDMLKLFYPYANFELRKEVNSYICIYIVCNN